MKMVIVALTELEQSMQLISHDEKVETIKASVQEQ